MIKRNGTFLWPAAAVVLAAGLLLCACGGESYLQRAGEAPDAAAEAEEDAAPAETPQAPRICVQITGAVAKPGVYFLDPDARLYMLVEAAGGLTDEADADTVNQARTLADGEQVHIRTREQTAEARAEGDAASVPGAEADDGRIDLNTADAAALSALPGIGESKAEAIVAFRREHGPFASPEDIMLVPGIKSGTYEKLKDRIAVR